MLLADPVADESKSHVYLLSSNRDVELVYKVIKDGGLLVTVPESVHLSVPWTIKMTYVT